MKRSKVAPTRTPVGPVVQMYGGRHVGQRVREADPDGRIVEHVVCRDAWPLDGMLQRKTIDTAMWQAGDDFRRDYYRAGMTEHFTTSRWSAGFRAPNTTAIRDDDVGLEARRRIRGAISALIELGDLTPSLVQHVVGDGRAISDWVDRMRGGGRRPVNYHFARGLLCAALARLAVHYGHRAEGARLLA